MSSGGYDAADLADQIREGDVNASIDAVLSDQESIGNLILAAERADLEQDTSPLVQLVSRSSQTDMLRKARQKGHVPSMNAATGLSEQRIDATGYTRLINACKPAAQQILLKGQKGTGKTVAALDIGRRLHAEFDEELSIATNIKGPDEQDDVTFVETMSEMLEWVRDTPGEKLVIGDEWSTTMNAHANPGGQVRQTVSRFINALRKGKGGSTRLLVIGHEHDTDIAAILRTQSDVVIQKDGKADEGMADLATVYDGWQDYLEDDHWFKLRGLQDVPESSVWGADTNYFAHFEIDLDNPHEQIRRGRLVDHWEELQDDTDNENGESSEVVCRGVKSDGDDCNALTSHESGFCKYHRDQWDGDTDPRLEDD
ncbi:hypothetical protein [Natronobacterium gregoryi]|uniref:Uncharacterized protein n=2 Tax=Natronobacterium gregoryi TaxID=44930 RepID=L0ABZ7_NATGS|nr:hypothetical protein [Natronobacterium gregoryi]AFZ71423.1 hypothetical protein Natgr_0159 [Natronobacterium gregoryi SP2]ELY66948.1 hypothetical protein C490_11948 [Natronobacterium gregoryi SP2]PLK21197.1 hypothetical protein CYV19_05100 [Natronobacterium gregoryi SP2]SFI84189.1 hypothetical protein SAMN05443661_10710 [Natronobacterium gregoryi]